ncbi:ornithine cyclodeaminase [Sphingobium sp. AP50]|uniref:ornithine cyclodeaminase family protein n=1 Tax=Sphingobium sp. AP50 TaxID=1884369 RepID=UPI0008B715D1|nr:ornithine cyclodeaminase family protein [Sphingobium sp. AP50]SEJ73961.1 ornithine cyclodeaminase [Sphingobium sp. AP50]
MAHIFNEQDVAQQLTPTRCAHWVARAMIALSTDARDQPLRNIIPVAPGRLFALMPGSLPLFGLVGAKVITAYPQSPGSQRTRHRGMVLGFDSESGELIGMADAHEVTLIRTAVASAIATNALARPDAARLTVMGTGAQAQSHARVLAELRTLDRIAIWGRDFTTAQQVAAELDARLAVPVVAIADAEQAVGEADILATVTGSPTPILMDAWVKPGTHINLVGSSHAGPYEADPPLVARARYYVDCEPYARVAAAEFLEAAKAGLIDDKQHIRGEIGQVLAGIRTGREHGGDVTIYKSLGHVVQDLAALRCLLELAKDQA